VRCRGRRREGASVASGRSGEGHGIAPVAPGTPDHYAATVEGVVQAAANAAGASIPSELWGRRWL
jgi:hypothetical protein